MNEITDFKFKETGRDNLYNMKHSHTSDYEILFVHSGSGNIVIKDKLVKIIPGTVYFINGSETHCSVPDNPESYCRSLIVMSSSFIDDVCQCLGCFPLTGFFFIEDGGMSVIPQKENIKEIERLFESINNAYLKNDEYFKSVLASAFINIMHICYGDKDHLPSHQSGTTGKVLEYINEHLAETIRLDSLCRECHISKYYLCHTFRQTLGITISDYIISRRLSDAVNYLKESDIPISLLAEKSGFSSTSYFSMIFKREMGMTPRDFRKALTSDTPPANR